MKRHKALAPCLIEPLEARIAPATVGNLDLSVTINSFKLPDVAVPGDTGSITFTIHNDDPTHDFASDHLDVNIWLSKDTTPIPQGYALVNSSFMATHQIVTNGTPDIKIAIPHNQGKQRTENFTMPDLYLGALVGPALADFGGAYNLTPGTGYHIIVEVDGAQIVDPFQHTDNSAASAPFEWAFEFGAVGSRTSGVELTAKDPDSTVVFFELKGPGAGEFQLQNSPNLTDLVFTGISASTSVVANVLRSGIGNNRFTLDDITAHGSLKGLNMPTADITGNLTFEGALGGLQLGNVFRTNSNSKTLTIGGALVTDATKLILGEVKDLNVIAPAGLAVLEAKSWEKVSNPNLITTPFINDLSTTVGDFDASLNLAGVPDKKGHLKAIGVADIAAALGSGTWTVAGDIGKIDASDIFSDWTLAGTTNLFGPLPPSATVVGNLVVTDEMNGTLTAAKFENVQIFGLLTGKIYVQRGEPNDGGIDVFKARRIVNGTIGADSQIGKMMVGDWQGGSLNAGKLDSLTVKGNGSVDLPGNLSNVQITVSGKTGKIDVDGFIVGSTLNLEDGAKTVQARGMNNSSLTALNATIEKFTIDGTEKGTEFFTSSTIHADVIKAVVIRNVDPNNSGNKFGVIAHQVLKYLRTQDGKPVPGAHLSRLLTPPPVGDPPFDKAGDYELQIVL